MPDTEDPVTNELRKITKLLAIGLLEGKQRDRIQKMSTAGFSPKEIADALGLKSNLVSAELSNLKKSKQRRND